MLPSVAYVASRDNTDSILNFMEDLSQEWVVKN